MRFMFVALFALGAASCASAVYDSLERQGVSRADLALDRLQSVRTDVAGARAAIADIDAALAAVDGADARSLAAAIAKLRSARSKSALAADELRLSLDTLRGATTRHFKEWEAQLAFHQDAVARQSDAARLAEARAAEAAFRAAADSALLRLSPTLSLVDQEARFLAENSSVLAAQSRRPQRDGVRRETAALRNAFDAVLTRADALRAALSQS